MVLERVSRKTGQLRKMELPISKEEIIKWEKGTPVQDVWPHLSIAERQFIVTGITPEEEKGKP